jgi:hypothetical protein
MTAPARTLSLRDLGDFVSPDESACLDATRCETLRNAFVQACLQGMCEANPQPKT